MSKFIHVFPLSIYRDTISLSAVYKKALVDKVLEMEQAGAKRQKGEDSAWLGDTQGFEFLYKVEPFADLYREISRCIKDYVHSLGVNVDLIEFFYQRSWATVSRSGEKIHEHAHMQSNISFAYYLKKPDSSGGINFITYDHPNEFSAGTFTPSKSELGFISEPSMLTWNIVNIDPKEDEIYIFPSKTLHSTDPNKSSEPRISISADVTTMLRDSSGHETMMPHLSNWQSLDE
jgi:uncharacterized protein (TIGR02466 family)